MSINEWLRRLNFQQYAPKFRKDGLKRVSDLKFLPKLFRLFLPLSIGLFWQLAKGT